MSHHSHVFLENFIDILQVFRRYEDFLRQYQLFLSIFRIFRDFFVTKKTNDVAYSR